ncbi:MAG: hypothetical protein RR846_01580, partial [Oscillospiraceae bacterium]
MPTGMLQIMAVTQGSIPLKNVKITITDAESMKVLNDKTTYTNAQGKTNNIILCTKPKRLSLEEDNREIPYKNYNVCVELGKYIRGEILGAQIFEGETTVQYIDLLPRPTDFGSEFERKFDVGEPEKLYEPEPDLKEGISSYVLQSVVIPDYITVHLGKP